VYTRARAIIAAPAMVPVCARCHRPLDPLESVASPQGPVHHSCQVLTDLRPPVFSEINVVRPPPAYGAPPMRRVLPLTLLGAIAAAAYWLIRHC
jgi:hypothetical protein